MEKSLLVFEKFVRSEATKKTYLHYFNAFMKWSQENVEKLVTPDGLLQLKEEYLQEIVEDYLMHLRKRLSPNSIPSIIASLELFFSMNDKNLQFKKIRRMVPTMMKKSGHGAWSNADIQKMLKNSVSRRDEAFVHFLASTGCRIGALQELRLKHLSNMPDNCKSVIFYEGSNEEYYGFLTPEANKALDEYLEERRKDGEYIDQETPVFRSSYQIGIQKVKPMSTASAKMIALRLAKSIARKKQGRRYTIMSAHGFRKRFNTILKSADNANQSLCEKLMGHRGIFHLDGSYLTPSKDQLFTEFKKHIQNLTVDDTARLQLKNQKLEVEKSELEEKISRIDDLERRFRIMEKTRNEEDKTRQEDLEKRLRMLEKTDTKKN
jgi:integrase/recombinase XerD